MISNILTRIFGSRNERLLKQYAQVVQKINALEQDTAALSDEALRAKTGELKALTKGNPSGFPSAKQKREAKEARAQVEQDPFVRSVMEAFPGAEIVSVRSLPAPDAAPADAEPPPAEDDAEDED